MEPATRVASVQTAAMTVRRSMRSDSRPTGYWVTAAARMLSAMKVATLTVVRPLSRAYTGPIEKMVAEIRPDTVTPTTPRGELRYKVGRLTFRGTERSGSCCAETMMGTIAREISTETNMNGLGVSGLDAINRNCAAPRPRYRTSM